MKTTTAFLVFLFFAFGLVIPASAQSRIRLGIDVLEQNGFGILRGKRVGLITNQTGVNSAGRRTREILHKANGVNLVALFTPEHGLDGTELAGKHVTTRIDPLTGLKAWSLYGDTRKPTPQMLAGLDILVFDMQDIGCRSYTYVSTMGRCMEAAGEAGIEFLVLDRPNPLGGTRVEGPLIESRWISFVGQFPVPYVHGLTAGELARMVNARGWMAAKCDLKVVRMEGWTREMTWNDTGLRWVRTSPNIPRSSSPFYYVVTGVAGSLSGLDTGVGGPEPFEKVTAPWLNGQSFAARLKPVLRGGVRVTPLSNGVVFDIDQHTPTDLTALALYVLAEVNRGARPDLFARSSASKLDIFYKVYGSQSIRQDLARGVPPQRIVASWERGIEQFRNERRAALLY